MTRFSCGSSSISKFSHHCSVWPFWRRSATLSWRRFLSHRNKLMTGFYMIRTSVVKELKCFIAWNKDISIALFHCSTVKVSLPTGNWSLQQKKNKIDLFNAVICKFLITLFTFDLKVPYVKPKSLILCCQKLSRLVFFTGRLDKNRPIPFPISSQLSCKSP